MYLLVICTLLWVAESKMQLQLGVTVIYLCLFYSSSNVLYIHGIETFGFSHLVLLHTTHRLKIIHVCTKDCEYCCQHRTKD